MEHRKLGKNGPSISVIGFGAWAIGGPWQFGWGPQDDRESVDAIQKAIDLGIDLIDTADVYGYGHSEEIVGQVLKDKRQQIFLATKGGLAWKEDGTTFRNSHNDYLMRAVENSLKRLQTDYIDLYQIHWPDLNVPVEEPARALKDMLKSGKIRYVGVSNYNVQQMREFMQVCPLTSLQPIYNMIDREAEQDLFPFCQEHGIGVLAYSPMASGLLTGKFTKDLHLPAGDHRLKDRHFQGEAFTNSLRMIDELKPVAASLNLTLPQLAIAWVLQNPAVTAALAGVRRPRQIQDTSAAAGVKLSPEVMDRIHSILTRQATVAGASD